MFYRRRISVFGVCLLGCFIAVSAQSIDRKHLSISAGGRYSHLLNGHNIYANLTGTHNYGIIDAKVGLSTLPEDSGWFERAFNYPPSALVFPMPVWGRSTSGMIPDWVIS